MLTMIAFLCFLVMMLMFYTLYYSLSSEKREIIKRLGLYVKERQAYNTTIITNQQKDNERKTFSGRYFIRNLSKYFERFNLSKPVERKILQAGLVLRGSEFMALCSSVSLFGGTTFLLLSKGNVFWGVFGITIGLLLPLIALNIKVVKRRRAFNNQLGDVLVLMANSLRTGYSFMQALVTVSTEMPPPISMEFSRVLKEVNLGVNTEDALNSLTKRIDSDDLDLVITAVLIQRQVGGNLAEVLDNIAGTIRARIKMKSEVRSLTAQGRISGIVIGLLPIALGVLIYLVNAQYVAVLFTHPTGRLMLLGALVSEVVGVIMIHRMTDIEL